MMGKWSKTESGGKKEGRQSDTPWRGTPCPKTSPQKGGPREKAHVFFPKNEDWGVQNLRGGELNLLDGKEGPIEGLTNGRKKKKRGVRKRQKNPGTTWEKRRRNRSILRQTAKRELQTRIKHKKGQETLRGM